MMTYERNMSVSLLRGLICTTAPLAFIFIVAGMYFAFAYDYPYAEAFSTASQEVRWWYRTYPIYILPAHFFVFLATIVYRKRLVNWWAQLVAITGISFVALLVYYTINPGQTPSILLPHEARELHQAAPKPAGPPPRPNLLGGMRSPSQRTVEIQPDADGFYRVNARALASPVAFTLEPRSDITTIAYDKLREFSSLPCAPFQLPTGNGSVDACSMTIPDLNVGGISLVQVNVVFVSTILDRSYLGRDVLTALGYRRESQTVFLGKH